MIIYYPHTIWKNENGKKSNGAKRSQPRVKVKCDKCNNIFIEKESIFNKRLKLINKEYCGNCARPLMSRLAGLKSNYDENGNLKKNSGRFTSEKWINLSDKKKEKRTRHNKKIAVDFHKFLNENPEKKIEHYKKVFKNSIIGYISKGQNEIYDILKNDGYELDGYVSGMRIDIVNKDKKIAIEYNGDYWHCNPRYWNPDDYNKAINMFAKEKWNNDRNRRFVLRKFGYDVHVIWENDWVYNRNKIYKLLNKITDNDYKFEKWEYKETKPLKGRTFEDIYGEEKAKILKKNMSIRQTGKKMNKNFIFKVVTPNQGIFYVNRIGNWHKIIKNSHSKLLKYNKIPKNNNYELWNEKEIELILNVKCPHCGLIGKNIRNMTRYHFNNCKQK